MPPVQTRPRRGSNSTGVHDVTGGAVTLATLVLPVSGQQPQQVPATMSLEDAIELA